MGMCQLAEIGVMLNDIRWKRSIGLKFHQHIFLLVCVYSALLVSFTKFEFEILRPN